jgi:hypothetical protein
MTLSFALQGHEDLDIEQLLSPEPTQNRDVVPDLVQGYAIPKMGLLSPSSARLSLNPA